MHKGPSFFLTFRPNDYGGNVVPRRTPAAGTRAPKGTRVDLVINESDD